MCSKFPRPALQAVSIFLAVCFTSIFGAAEARTLAIGTISADPVGEIRTFKPFADYLARHLAPDGVSEVKVVVAGDIPEIAGMLKRGEVDLFYRQPRHGIDREPTLWRQIHC